MDLFDIVGPIMVGPSSSHTAGAVRMGYVAGKLLGEPIKKAEILLYGSFLATGEGHGTKKAIVAGLLGMQPDDYEIADSFEIAQKRGIEIVFGEARLEDAHPNTAVIRLEGAGEKSIEVQVSSIGGSRSGSAGTCIGSNVYACAQECEHCNHAAVPFGKGTDGCYGCGM